MGTKRTEPNDHIFEARQRYYLKHKTKILAKAKARYRKERDLRLEIARRVRTELKKESPESQPKPESRKGLLGQWIQRFKSKTTPPVNSEVKET